ncbi:MAG TPA: COX15/CtaA family protein [Alphaproteobacteria bacterium]|jgi:cytochrome c oxidase assembly protein subunit 15|nr:COX15/CtaA family protein [Alphaproteobacteria bacterium]
MSQSQPVRTAPDLHLLPGRQTVAVPRGVRIWLFVIAGLCFAIAVIGAITRLTESGLSIAEWKPVQNLIPPLTTAEWERMFDIYKQSPQYLQVNRGMSLAEYQGIFWWEWAHREIAQLIGVAFAVPFLYFLARRQIPRRLAPYLVGLFVLGGLQGLIGWAMVASGLVHRPSVSHYRLAAHLSMDLTIYSLTLWTAFFVSRPRATLLTPVGDLRVLRKHAALGLTMLAITMVWGAFTAGLRGGLVYNTFPLMGGGIVPPDLLGMHPWWSNFVENPGSVQFVHRVLAMTAGLIILALALRLRGKGIAPELGKLATALFVIVALQITLGIETVLHQVPVWLGALHQANAILLLGLMVRTLFLLRVPSAPRFKPKVIAGAVR